MTTLLILLGLAAALFAAALLVIFRHKPDTGADIPDEPDAPLSPCVCGWEPMIRGFFNESANLWDCTVICPTCRRNVTRLRASEDDALDAAIAGWNRQMDEERRRGNAR